MAGSRIRRAQHRSRPRADAQPGLRWAGAGELDAITLEVIALLLILGRRIGGVEGRETALSLLRTLAASAVMAGVVIVIAGLAERAGWGNLMTLAACGAAGVVAYLAAARLVRLDAIWRFAAALEPRRR